MFFFWVKICIYSDLICLCDNFSLAYRSSLVFDWHCYSYCHCTQFVICTYNGINKQTQTLMKKSYVTTHSAFTKGTHVHEQHTYAIYECNAHIHMKWKAKSLKLWIKTFRTHTHTHRGGHKKTHIHICSFEYLNECTFARICFCSCCFCCYCCCYFYQHK